MSTTRSTARASDERRSDESAHQDEQSAAMRALDALEMWHESIEQSERAHQDESARIAALRS